MKQLDLFNLSSSRLETFVERSGSTLNIPEGLQTIPVYAWTPSLSRKVYT